MSKLTTEPRRCECGALLLPDEQKCWLCYNVQSSPMRAASANEFSDRGLTPGKRGRIVKTLSWLGVCGGLVAMAAFMIAGGDIRSQGFVLMLLGPPLVLTGAFGALMTALLPGPEERGGCMFAAVIALFLPASLVAWIFILCSNTSFH